MRWLVVFRLVAGLTGTVLGGTPTADTSAPALGRLFRFDRVLSCRPGPAPGEYVYRIYPDSSVDNVFPRCFALDPANGGIVIPEVYDRYDCKMRMHRFDPAGRFISTVAVPGKAWTVDAAAVDYEGAVFLFASLPPYEPRYWIGRYDQEGHLLVRFGPEGPFTAEETAAEAEEMEVRQNRRISARPGYPSKQRYFDSGYGYRLYPLPDGTLFFLPGFFPAPTPGQPKPRVPGYRFDGRTGRCLDKASYAADLSMPDDLAKRWRAYTPAVEGFRAAYRRAAGEYSRGGGEVLDNEGHLFTMQVSEKELKILRITFLDPTTTAPATQPAPGDREPATKKAAKQPPKRAVPKNRARKGP